MKIKAFFLIILLTLSNCKEKETEFGNVNQITKDEITGGFDRKKYPILQKAISLKENGSFEKAIDKFDEAEKKYGPMLSIYLNRGVTYFQSGLPEKSIANFTKCLNIDSEYYAALNNRGIAYVHIEQYKNAIVDLTKAIQIIPLEPSTYLNRAIAYNQIGNDELACKDLKKGIELGIVVERIPNYLNSDCGF
ncbi:tetratricopeptide repeat protein [Psychroserpens algicola]|uniref:tetratricopeptide repeat protein n=1 Tax=Psychroserpens algicola TaxID=1719034 RepID=UPI0019543E71|nr:hypothetical protein [Psychroserpens algicola]